ncbi:MAG: isoprenylcysteine carboxylmethyltransferase family protein [Dehalococcoidia bacterium]
MNDGQGRAIGWALVAAQFVLLGAIGVEVLGALRERRVPAPAGLAGVVAAAPGIWLIARASRRLGRRLSAHPAPVANAVLRTDGAYGVVRHPIYVGLLLLGVASVIIARTPRAAIALGALVALFNAKSRMEERLLARRFPGYAAYAARVPRFVPRFRR